MICRLTFAEQMVDNISFIDDTITSDTGDLNFGNENLITTETGTFGKVIADNITIDAAIISSDTGNISFDDEHLFTTGGATINNLSFQIGTPIVPVSSATYLNADVSWGDVGGSGIGGFSAVISGRGVLGEGTTYAVGDSIRGLSFLGGLAVLGDPKGSSNLDVFGISVTGGGSVLTTVTFGDVYGIHVIPTSTITGSTTINNLYGIRITDTDFTGGVEAIGTQQGLWIDDQTKGSTNYGIVLDGDGTGADLVLGDGQDASIYYNGFDLVIDPDVVGTGSVKINDTWRLPNLDGSANDILKTDGLGQSSFVTPTSHTQLSFSMYDAEPARGSETSLDGAFISLATAQPLNSVPTDVVVSKGIGKLVVVVNAGSDLAGDITVTGTSVDRDTGATTGADTDTLTVDALTTDDSDTDTNTNIRHAFTGAYITSKWFTGSVTLSTVNLTLTDIDVYHVSFEQFDDTANITLDTFDANILTTNVNAEFDAYIYALMVIGDKCNITREASLNVGADGETAIADRYWRLRRGNIAKTIDGTTDGTWVDVHYANSPAYVEDVSIKVWATEIVPLTLN